MVDASGRKVIGQRVGDATEGEVWIRGFKEGETQLRILQPTIDWWKYAEHYGGGELGFFPCLGSAEDGCIGCNDLSERVRNRSWKYLFNALDKDGRVRAFKLGGQLKKRLVRAEQRMGSDILLRRDIVIIRIGSGFSDTEYDFEWGEEYDLGDKMPGEEDLHDLGGVVTEKYYATEALYNDPGDPEDDNAEPEEAVEAKPAKKAAAKKTARPKAKAVEAPEPEPEPEAEVADDSDDGADDGGDANAEAVEVDTEQVDKFFQKVKDEYDTPEIREILTKQGIDVPPRSARPRVLALLEQALYDGTIAPF